MKIQLKYILLDIFENKGYFLSYMIQIMVAIFLMGYIVLSYVDLIDFREKLEAIGDLDTTYIMSEVTDDKIVSENVINSPDGRERIFRLYEFIKNSSNFHSYSFYNSGININDDRLPKTLKEDVYSEYSLNRVLYADDNFFKFFKVSVIEGRDFTQEDYSVESKYLPVILGREYKSYYGLGDIIEEQFQVVGFLEKGQFYMNPQSTKEVLYLDKTIICPLVINSNSRIAELDMALFGTHIITGNLSNLLNIQEKSTSLELFTYRFKSLERQKQMIIEDELIKVRAVILIMSLILLLCTICMITTLINFIENHIKEFAIHLLSGGTIKQLSFRIGFQVSLLIVIAYAITIILLKDLRLLLPLGGFSAAISFSIIILPAIKIYRLGIRGILRRCE